MDTTDRRNIWGIFKYVLAAIAWSFFIGLAAMYGLEFLIFLSTFRSEKGYALDATGQDITFFSVFFIALIIRLTIFYKKLKSIQD